ncbi:MAG: hypothetical protein RLZZ401_1460 [Pseudomonadota bacterium]|jgi:hypothetical protein
MRPALLDPSTNNHADETHRHAYNAAFCELDLSWHWDRVTYGRLQLQTQGHADVRAYLQAEQPHLLRAYEADFLVNAIEAAKARCHASMAASWTRPIVCSGLPDRELLNIES